MSPLLPLAVLCFTAAAVSFARRLAAVRELRVSLDRAARSAVAAPAPEAALRRSHVPGAERLQRLALRLRPGTTLEQVSLRLAAAGLTRRATPEGYLAAQGALIAAAAVLGLLVALSGGATRGLVFAGPAVAGAILLPDRLLAARASRRQERVLAALPGALDLLAITVEAGLGFDAALARVAAVTEGPLADELSLMLGEIRLGEARPVALERLAQRSGVGEVAAFARAVARADQLGTSLGQTLRIQAADARARRQVAAEERAGKAPVKMLFPTVIFIFPALFAVVLGPAVLSISKFL